MSKRAGKGSVVDDELAELQRAADAAAAAARTAGDNVRARWWLLETQATVGANDRLNAQARAIVARAEAGGRVRDVHRAGQVAAAAAAAAGSAKRGDRRGAPAATIALDYVDDEAGPMPTKAQVEAQQQKTKKKQQQQHAGIGGSEHGHDGDGGMPPEIAHVVRTRDYIIYQARFKWFVAAMLLLIAVTLWRAPTLPLALGTLLLMYFYVDCYGAVLHITLDNPNFLTLPIIGQACLEFQYHHQLPFDIARRSMLDVWGDLNGLLLAKSAMVLAYFGTGDRVAHMLLGAGVALAYLNQWSHRQTHKGRVAPWVAALQRASVILPPAVHRQHHSTYDSAFAVLNGHSNRAITAALGVTSNQWLWLAVFAAMTLFDVFALKALYSAVGIATPYAAAEGTSPLQYAARWWAASQ